MINLLGAALIGLATPVIPHNVATLGVWPASAPPIVSPPASGRGGGGWQAAYRFPEEAEGLSAASRVVILTAIALTEILQ